MNPKLILTIYSFRKELTYVALAFLIALSIPVIAVFILANTGIDLVSEKLASVNPQTQTVADNVWTDNLLSLPKCTY
jgi:uncharacterized membrane protein